jgi:HAD superfamily hydrolase (TIGR01509 family)
VIERVSLDVDGTLMDTNYHHVEAWARAFRDLGCQVPRSAIHRQIGKGAEQLLPLFVPNEADHGRADELHSRYYAELRRSAGPLPGGKELLAALAARSCAIWLATSAKADELADHLLALEADGKLAGVVSSADVTASKPAPNIFALALQRSGGGTAKSIAVGDTIWDIEAAGLVGLRTVAVLTGGAYSRAELESAGAIAVYADCAALLTEGCFDQL